MTKTDIDEIFACQLYSYRFAFFATAILNFFLPAAWAVSSVAGGVNFTAWDWATGFQVTYNGVAVFEHQGEGLFVTFVAAVIGVIASFVPSRKAAIAAAVAAAAGLFFAWGEWRTAVALATQNTEPGIVEIKAASAWGWIMVPLAMAFAVYVYAAFFADRGFLFGEGASEEE